MFTASRNSACTSSAMVQRARLVDGLAPGLVTLHLVLRVVGRRVDRPARGLGPLGDLLLDLAVDRLAVALPGDVVALFQILGHAVRGTRQRSGKTADEDRRSGEQPAPQRAPLPPRLLVPLRPLG